MSLFKKNILFYIIIFIIINIPIYPYASELMFNNITVSDGLSQTTVTTLFQDSYGYMWIGTTDGLNKYNGYDFKVYNKDLEKGSKIISGHICSINEDSNNNLWVGTINGLSKINLKNNEINNYTINNSLLPSNSINSIKITDNGEVIIATGNGLALYDDNKNDFITLSIDNKSIDSNNIKDIEIYNNELYGIISNYLFKYNLKTHSYTKIITLNLDNQKENDAFTDISICNNEIYIGTLAQGVYIYNLDNYELNNHYQFLKDNSINKSYRVNYIYNDEHALWVATTNGVYVYENTGSVHKYTKNITDKYSLINNNVKYITNDSSGLIWLGTDSGISTVDYNLGIKYYNNYAHSLDVNANVVMSIYQDPNEIFYLGSSGNGLCIYDLKNDTTSYITTKTENKLSSDIIYDVAGNDKYVFVATDNGLNIIDINTLEVKVISDELSNKTVTSLYVDNNRLFLGVLGGYDIVNLDDFTTKSMNELLYSNNIKIDVGGVIFKDSQGIYWFGSCSNDGLVRFNPSDNSFKLYKYDELNNSISNNSVMSIAEDSSGNLWFGTERGLNKFDRNAENFKCYSVMDGLSNNTIYSIVPVDNSIWISTNTGINCINFSDDNISDMKTYLSGTEFVINSSFKSKNGKIAFGAIDGIYTLNPYTLKNKNYIPNLKFDSITLNGAPVDTLKNLSILSDECTITVNLFTNFYNHTEQVKFYYKINPEDNWKLMNSNKITFSNFIAGKYNIQFKAIKSDGNTSNLETLSFKVVPPFWKSTTAKSIYIILLIILLLYLCLRIFYMSNDINLKNYQLSKEMKQKNELLMKNVQLERRKNNYLINMSHELRTPLNVIYSIQQLIVDLNNKGPISQKDLTKYMDMSNNNVKRLLKLTNDLIDSTKIDDGSYKLFFEEKDIIYVIEESALSLKNMIEEKGIELTIDTNIEECIMKFDETAIERCIVNIVNNAYKFTEPGGQIFVNIIDMHTILRIDIKDTGCGLSEENIPTIFDRFNQVVNSKRETSDGSGLGLTITKRLIHLHKGHIFVKSELGKGSTFTIVLPKNTYTNLINSR